ncbi:MFS transporter [Auritidibacter ignavus]|uniref:MFS transporter n=1 Tax=Auritidibacter ignavus TaxID=678932 RepID=UPI0024B8D13E|nr:MFS transporter [Auritidibacter ignavus]WHS34391.1 MFS transporter [Auritidibacter ignavus]
MSNSPPNTLPPGTLSKRALVVASLALFVDNLVIGLAVPVLPLLPPVVEAGSAMTGVLFASYAIALVLSALLSGRLVDRVGPKAPLLIGMVGLAAATLMFAIGGPFWLLVVTRFAQGVAGGMSWVAGLALIAATTSFDKRGMAMGIAISTITLGVLIGPPLAGFMVGEFGTSSPFIFAAGVAVLDGILRITLVRKVPRIADDTGSPLTVLRVPGSASIIIAIAIGAAVIAALEPVLPVHLNESPLAIGLLFALAALVGVIANPVVGSMVSRVSPRILIGLGIASVVVSLLLVGWSTHIWQIAIGMGLLGTAAAFLQAPATALISVQGFRSQPPTLGGSYSLYTLAYAVGLAVGPLLAGFAVEQLGFPNAMTLTAVVLAIVGAMSLGRLPGMPTDEASVDHGSTQSRA